MTRRRSAGSIDLWMRPRFKSLLVMLVTNAPLRCRCSATRLTLTSPSSASRCRIEINVEYSTPSRPMRAACCNLVTRILPFSAPGASRRGCVPSVASVPDASAAPVAPSNLPVPPSRPPATPCRSSPPVARSIPPAPGRPDLELARLGAVAERHPRSHARPVPLRGAREPPTSEPGSLTQTALVRPFADFSGLGVLGVVVPKPVVKTKARKAAKSR